LASVFVGDLVSVCAEVDVSVCPTAMTQVAIAITSVKAICMKKREDKGNPFLVEQVNLNIFDYPDGLNIDWQPITERKIRPILIDKRRFIDRRWASALSMLAQR